MQKLLIYFPLILMLGCEATPIDQVQLDDAPDEVELFGRDLISTGLYERDIAISLDGQELIYTLGDYKQTRRSLISLKKGENGWGERKVLSFSGEYQDIEPFFSPDGRQLFFASNRPMGEEKERKDYNIWVSERQGEDWSTPQALSSEINTEKDEFYPAVSKNGSLYFTATRGDGIGREDIFVSRYVDGAYQTPQVLDTMINSLVYEFNAYINPEEDFLIFSSFGRKDGQGGGDLYFSKKDAAGNWMEAQNMGLPINSDKLDYCPFVDWPRGNFYFTSEKAPLSKAPISSVSALTEHANQILNGMGNIYRIHIDHLDQF